MPVIPNTTLAKLRSGKIAIAFSVNHLRSVSVPMMARAAGFDWLFIDMEHSAFSLHEATQLCIAALPTGVTPIVRVCSGAFDEGTRALDNGAQGSRDPPCEHACRGKPSGRSLPVSAPWLA